MTLSIRLIGLSIAFNSADNLEPVEIFDQVVWLYHDISGNSAQWILVWGGNAYRVTVTLVEYRKDITEAWTMTLKIKIKKEQHLIDQLEEIELINVL